MFPTSLEYQQCRRTHPTYDAKYWAQCRALYQSGPALTRDKTILAQVLPRHSHEEEWFYHDRCERAVHMPYPGSIIDMLASGLFAVGLELEGEPEADEWWGGWWKDVSRKGGNRVSLVQLLRRQMITALQLRTAWTLVELPEMAQEIASRAEEEELMRPYACAVAPECVRDWEETEDGVLLWALVETRSAPRMALADDRSQIRESYVVYSADEWARYEISYDAEKPPADKAAVPMAASGKHSFGTVPLVRLELPEGLWAMGKIESLARAHFQTSTGLHFGSELALYPQAVVQQGPAVPMNPITEDENRGKNQTLGIGRMMTLGDGDTFSYVSPDATPYTVAMAQLSHYRDEMHRVLHHMAMSVDNSGAALQRSAESKSIDMVATAIVLGALGELVRDHVEKVAVLAAAGRGDVIKWTAHGLDDYDADSVAQLLEQAQIIDTVSIPSPTFHRAWKAQLAMRLLGKELTADEAQMVREEIERNTSDEQFTAPVFGAQKGDEEGDEEGDEDESDEKPNDAAKDESAA